MNSCRLLPLQSDMTYRQTFFENWKDESFSIYYPNMLLSALRH